MIYAGLYVNLEEVRHRIRADSAELLDQSEAATIVGVNREIVRMLASDGSLPSVTIVNPETGLRKRAYCRSDMKTFAANYISLTSAARLNNIHARVLRAELDRLNIQKISDDHYGARIYRRQDLTLAGFAG